MWMSFLVERELSIKLLGSLTVYVELVTETLFNVSESGEN